MVYQPLSDIVSNYSVFGLQLQLLAQFWLPWLPHWSTVAATKLLFGMSDGQIGHTMHHNQLAWPPLQTMMPWPQHQLPPLATTWPQGRGHPHGLHTIAMAI